MTDDAVIDFIKAKAARCSAIERVLLFGSRARGTHGPRSDYDIAVQIDDDQEWGAWATDLRESVPTLAGLDLIRLDRNTDASIANAIAREGKVIYERKSKL